MILSPSLSSETYFAQDSFFVFVVPELCLLGGGNFSQGFSFWILYDIFFCCDFVFALDKCLANFFEHYPIRCGFGNHLFAIKVVENL